jgi:hypothetical protein
LRLFSMPLMVSRFSMVSGERLECHVSQRRFEILIYREKVSNVVAVDHPVGVRARGIHSLGESP